MFSVHFVRGKMFQQIPFWRSIIPQCVHTTNFVGSCGRDYCSGKTIHKRIQNWQYKVKVSVLQLLFYCRKLFVARTLAKINFSDNNGLLVTKVLSWKEKNNIASLISLFRLLGMKVYFDTRTLLKLEHVLYALSMFSCKN